MLSNSFAFLTIKWTILKNLSVTSQSLKVIYFWILLPTNHIQYHQSHTLKIRLLINQLMFIKETKRDIITCSSLWWYGTLSGMKQRLSHSLVNKHNHWKLTTVITLFCSITVRYLKNHLRLKHLISYKIFPNHKKV